jgi:hypothetical protein
MLKIFDFNLQMEDDPKCGCNCQCGGHSKNYGDGYYHGTRDGAHDRPANN